MAKQYTYDPRKMQGGGATAPTTGVNPILSRVVSGVKPMLNTVLNARIPFVSNPTSYTREEVLNAPAPITEDEYNAATYMRPYASAGEDSTFGVGNNANPTYTERAMNFAYNNPGLLNMAIKTPFLGDKVIDKVKDFMRKSGGSSIYSDAWQKKTNPEVDGYQGTFSLPTWAKGRDPNINPINQYFTNEDLYQPANTYDADLPYADFMPYYSAKGTEFDANINQDPYNMRRLGIRPSEEGGFNIFENELGENAFRNRSEEDIANQPKYSDYEVSIPAGVSDKEWQKLIQQKNLQDKKYQEDYENWKSDIKNRGVEDFLTNKNTIYGQAYERPDISSLMGVDYGASRAGFGFDKNLPFMSVSDAWDFQGIGKGGYGSKWDSKSGLIQSQLVQQAAEAAKGDTPGFGFYDRLYFHPERNEQGGFEYIKEADIPFYQDYYSPNTNRLDEVVITAPRMQGGGSVLNNKKLEKKYNIPTYKEFAEMYNINPADTTFFGYGDDKMSMVADELQNARIQKRLKEGQTDFTLPYISQNFSTDNFIEFPSKKEGKDPLKVYYETYNKEKLQDGGPTPPPRMTERQLREAIAAQKQLMADYEAGHLADFRNNITAMGQGFMNPYQEDIENYLANQGSELDPRLFTPTEQGIVGLDTVPAVTRNWLRNKPGVQSGCTTFGCGILGTAGAELTDDIMINDRMRSGGDRYPIVSGNSQLNSLIESNPEAMGTQLLPAEGFNYQTDFLPGDRVVSDYSTSGKENSQHTMIFSHYDPDTGQPMMMENSGGWVPGGVSVNPLFDIKSQDKYSFDPNSDLRPLRVTRYTGQMQNYQNELDRLNTMLSEGNFRPTPVSVSSLNALPLQPIPMTPTMPTAEILQQPVPVPPTMQYGGFLSQDYFNRQSLFGMGPGSAADRQAYRLQGLQGRSSVIPGQGSLSGMTPLTGQAGIQQQRLTNRMVNAGMDPTQITDAGAGGAKGMRQALRQQRMEKFNNSAMGKMSGNMGMLGSLASGFVLSGGDGSYDPGAAGLAGGLAGAGTGAQMGAALGPIGMAAGAILGAGIGAITATDRAKREEEKRKNKKEDALAANIAAGKSTDEARSAGVLSQYPTEGITSSYYAKYGGMMGTPDYVVEGGELMMAPNNNPPKTDNNGRVTQIGKNMFKFEGDTHDAPSGGIGVQGGNSEFASQTNQVLDSGFVFSDRLKANPDDYLKNI